MGSLVIKYDTEEPRIIFNVAEAWIKDYKIFIELENGKKKVIKIFDKVGDDILTIKHAFVDGHRVFHLYELEHDRNLSAIEEEDKREK